MHKLDFFSFLIVGSILAHFRGHFSAQIFSLKTSSFGTVKMGKISFVVFEVLCECK